MPVRLNITLSRIWWSRNQLWNCTHFRHPTDEQLRQLDIYRSRTSDRGLSSSNLYKSYITKKNIPSILESVDLLDLLKFLRSLSVHPLAQMHEKQTWRTAIISWVRREKEQCCQGQLVWFPMITVSAAVCRLPWKPAKFWKKTNDLGQITWRKIAFPIGKGEILAGGKFY